MVLMVPIFLLLVRGAGRGVPRSRIEAEAVGVVISVVIRDCPLPVPFGRCRCPYVQLQSNVLEGRNPRPKVPRCRSSALCACRQGSSPAASCLAYGLAVAGPFRGSAHPPSFCIERGLLVDPGQCSSCFWASLKPLTSMSRTVRIDFWVFVFR